MLNEILLEISYLGRIWTTL